MAYADGKVDLLCERGIVIETLRQWFILFLSIGMIVIFVRAVIFLYKTHRKFSFDCLILASESVKVIPFINYLFIACSICLL